MIDWELLSKISYRTKLGKSLKNTLRKFEKNFVFEELDDMISFMTEFEKNITLEHRIKSLHSCLLKYEKYYPSTEMEKVFNDILGIRVIVDTYDVVDSIYVPKEVRIADMRNGKAIDDGYRGVHMYYQKDHFHYPIEIQFMTENDRIFNEWLHMFLYKYVKDNRIGMKLKFLYDIGLIRTEKDFKVEVEKLCAI